VLSLHHNQTTNKNKIYGLKKNKARYVGWSSMADIEKIYYGFYENSTHFLIRKKEIFDKIIEIIRNKKKYRKK
jgi:hypothetical protein